MSDYEKALLEYLKTSDPKIWHQIAWNWNWDDGHDEPIKWILNQKNCDKGTALLIFWYLGPRYFSRYAKRDEVPEYEIKHYDLIKDIEEKYKSGFYDHENIYFDPANDFDGHDWSRDYGEIEMKTQIPQIMYQPTKGVKLEREQIDEGYPQEVIDKVEANSPNSS